MADLNKQEQMYCDIVQLVADIARDGFGIDVARNPLFSGHFQRQLEQHHNRLVSFITKYVPNEPIVVPKLEPIEVPKIAFKQENTQPANVTE